MKKICALRLAAACMAVAAPTTVAIAQRATSATAGAAQPAPPAALVEQAFEAAGRGDLAPVERALRDARGAEAVLLRARLAAASYQGAPHRDAALVRLAMSGSPAEQRAALNVIASAAFVAGDYAAAAQAAERLAGLLRANGDAGAVAAIEMTRQVAAMLAAHPAQRVEGAVAHQGVPLRYDAVGLPRIDIGINGGTQEAVVDTGANLSVLSAEAARRLGIVPAEAAGEVGNAVGGTVAVRIGVAERVTIAGTTLRNVPFLIIDDAQLTFQVAGGYRIQAILGLPVLRALQRIRIGGETFAVEAPQAYDAVRQNLFANNSNLFVRAQVGGRDVPLHLDTGANQTSLTALFAQAHPQLVAELRTGEQQLASAGGARVNNAAVWPNPTIGVADRSITLPSVNIALASPADNYGTLGSSALRRFTDYAIDFRAMRLEPGEPIPR